MTNDVLLEKIHLVVEKLKNLGGADYSADRDLTENRKQRGIIARDFGIEEWDWPQGVGLYGLSKLQAYYGDNRYLDFFCNWYQKNLDRGLPSRNVNTTAPYLPLLDLIPDLNSGYEQMCLTHAKWLMHGLARTPEGGFQHVTSGIGDRDGVILNEGQLWVDTIFMTVLFLNKMGLKYNNREFTGEAVHQLLIHIKYLYDKQTGLFYHGWSFQRRDNFGGIFWCRGNSWFTYGIMDYLETCESHIDPGVNNYLIDTVRSQVAGLVKLQSPSGLWHTILDDPNSYEEVSGSAAIAAGILKGIKSGILDSAYQCCADQAIEAVCRNISDDGTVLHVSAGTAMGYDADHYKNIAIMPMAYGQSLTLLALYEALS